MIVSEELDPLLRAAMRAKGIEWPPEGGSLRNAAQELAIAIGEVPDRARTPAGRTDQHNSRIRTVQNWLQFENEPSFPSTVRLMVGAGLLDPLWVEQALAAQSPGDEVDPVTRRLAALSSAVDELLEGQEQLVENLRVTKERLEQFGAEQAARPSTAGGRGRKVAKRG